MTPIRTILHPTDFSPSSESALELAGALARDYGARLVIVHVVEPLAATIDGIVIPQPEQYFEDLRRKLEQVRPLERDIPVQHAFVKGAPVPEILRTIRDEACDLVVMGTHGRTGLGRLLMGSVAEQIIRKASCPVLTVKTPLAARSLNLETAAANA